MYNNYIFDLYGTLIGKPGGWGIMGCEKSSRQGGNHYAQ